MRNAQHSGCSTKQCTALASRLNVVPRLKTCYTSRGSLGTCAFRESWSDSAGALVTWSPAHTPALSLLQQEKQQQHSGQQQDSSLLQPGQTVLEQALPSLVRYLSIAGDAAPTCLQLVHSNNSSGPHGKQQHLTYEMVDLTGRDATSPQVWQEMAPVSKLQDTLAVVLARPIPDPSHFCPLGYAQQGNTRSSSQACGTPTGSSSSTQHTRTSRLPDLQGAVDVDDCCGGSIASQHVSELQQRAQQLVQSDGFDSTSSIGTLSTLANSDSGSSSDEDSRNTAAAAATASLHSSHSSHSNGQSRARRRFLRRQAARETATSSHTPNKVGQVAYYGLAVQTLQAGLSAGADAADWPIRQAQAQPDGCYVLKLSKNNDTTGCTCTMFTLTHVCQGAPLHQQLLHSWLVRA